MMDEGAAAGDQDALLQAQVVGALIGGGSTNNIDGLDDWNRLSFYGPPAPLSSSSAASLARLPSDVANVVGAMGTSSLLSASPGTVSTLAFLERKLMRENGVVMPPPQLAATSASSSSSDDSFLMGDTTTTSSTTATASLIHTAADHHSHHISTSEEIVFTEEDLLKIKALRQVAPQPQQPKNDPRNRTGAKRDQDGGGAIERSAPKRREHSAEGGSTTTTTTRKEEEASEASLLSFRKEKFHAGSTKPDVPRSPVSGVHRHNHHHRADDDSQVPTASGGHDDVLLTSTAEGLQSGVDSKMFVNPVSSDTTHQEREGGGGGKEAADEQSPEEEEGMGREWALQDKHFFILSDAGKPIYSRHGDEQKLSGLMGVMQGIFSFVSSSGDEIRTIYAGDHIMVFMARGPLYLVAIAKSGEPVPVLRQQLEYLQLQIVSTITSGITKIFESRPSFDLRGLLRGSTKFIDNLVLSMDKRPSYLVNASQCLPLKPAIRSVTGTYLQGVKSEDLVYALLIAESKLVNFVQPKKHPLQPEDLQLIFNFLESSGTFRTNETWVPICLPKFNDGGYLYAYLCYLDEYTCLVLVSTVRNSEKFYELAEWKQKIDKSLRAAGALSAIQQTVSRDSYRVKDLGIPGLVSFLYRHNHLHQFTMPSPDPPYDKPHEQVKVLRRYQKLWAKVLERPPCGMDGTSSGGVLPKHPHALRQYWAANDRESHLVWVSPDVLLFILFEPWVGRPQAVQAASDIIRWVKSNESLLFILPSATQTW